MAVTVVITEVTVGVEVEESWEVVEFEELSKTGLDKTVRSDGAAYGAAYEKEILDVEGRLEVEDVGNRDVKEEYGN